MSERDMDCQTRTTSLVDQMQATRGDNNIFWMTILRIALEEAPERTKAVIRQIAQRDAEIAGLFREIGNS